MTLYAASAATYAAYKLADNKLHLVSDVKTMWGLRKYLAVMKNLPETSTVTDLWYEALNKFGTQEAIAFEDQSLSYQDIEVRSNQVAHWAHKQGWNKKTVAMMMENRPEFIITWLGLTKAGVAAALLNTHIRGKSIKHSVHTAHSRAMLVSEEMLGPVADINLDGETGVGLPTFVLPPFTNGNTPSMPNLTEGCSAVDFSQFPTTKVPDSLREGIGKLDPWGYIYTSGTTGLPKACVFVHQRFFGITAIKDGYGLKEGDRCYTVLPLYHTAGGVIGVGFMFVGITMVLKKKFSATSWWRDVIHYRCTVAQYIGELCRYLLNAPPSGLDTAHKLRIMIGNGLRPEIWAQFQQRFNLPEIGEFYGSTEGNIALFNHCVTKEAQGAVGREGWLLNKFTGGSIVEFDVENEVPVRNKDGLCIRVKPGEVGELIAPIDEKRIFKGYTDQKATEKKILRNVFTKGDAFFRTGDLLRKDTRGYYFFVDRIGDTFRWKGENVSTMEVAEVLSVFPGVEEANVYGVKIPNKDGRACMAALTIAKPLDPTAFGKYVTSQLPAYSIPLFVRFIPSGDMNITQTFKHKKTELVGEGFDIDKVKQEMWWYNPATRTYQNFNRSAFETISAGKAKL
eukprot:TRINITY_DN66575_c7_g2_i1.p1 TRINITY_DN66575_c7_g2~~TRINITY_DN66575_c7_g2_i1.p1  ORF type:complete len:622 (+),score=91.41 TRINITY_DN66575_c7_g2_i1:30-1895(+)